MQRFFLYIVNQIPNIIIYKMNIKKVLTFVAIIWFISSTELCGNGIKDISEFCDYK